LGPDGNGRPDGRTAVEKGELPCVTVIRLDDAAIVDYRVHMDLTPAMAVPAGDG
jgi:hypothetical protein